uniref:Uncharacterized protein n=1 Tax=Romanomermis culicivorax TaxID=13658 RepID=A0A915JGX7_ROMCU
MCVTVSDFSKAKEICVCTILYCFATERKNQFTIVTPLKQCDSVMKGRMRKDHDYENLLSPMKKSKTTFDNIDERPLLTPKIDRRFLSYDSIIQHSASTGGETEEGNREKCANDNGYDEARDQSPTGNDTLPSIMVNFSVPEAQSPIVDDKNPRIFHF